MSGRSWEALQLKLRSWMLHQEVDYTDNCDASSRLKEALYKSSGTEYIIDHSTTYNIIVILHASVLFILGIWAQLSVTGSHSNFYLKLFFLCTTAVNWTLLLANTSSYSTRKLYIVKGRELVCWTKIRSRSRLMCGILEMVKEPD